MPSKQSPSKVSKSAEAVTETEPAVEAPLSPIAPATKRFKIAAVLFGGWLVFLIYLAWLTWSGK